MSYGPSLPKSLYTWHSTKVIEKFAMIDDDHLQVVRRFVRSVIINTIQSGNDCDLDLVLSQYASLSDDTEDDF
jgi:hypothetical protein